MRTSFLSTFVSFLGGLAELRPGSDGNGPSPSAVTLCVTARASRLDSAALHGDDSLRAQTRDAALDEARHDRRVRERLHLGLGDPEGFQERDAVLSFFLT
jgi:hypothetical protein